MYCEKCGKQLPDDAVFCSGCGAAANQSAPPREAVQGGQPPVSEPLPARRRGMPRRLLVLLISLGAAAVLAAGVIVGVFVIGPGAGGPKDLPAAASATPGGAGATPSPGKSTEPDTQNAFKPPVPGDGESLYVGEASYDEAETFKVAFILSADGGTLHDVTIYAENLKVKINKGNSVTNVSLKSVKETYSGSYPVGDTSSEIDLGKTKISELVFTDDGAIGEIEYVYTHRDLNGGSSVDVPLGIKKIEFTKNDSSNAEAEPAAEETQAPEDNDAGAGAGETAQVVFEKKTYAVSIGEIGTSDEGKTTVEVCSPGIGTTMPFRNNKLIVPVQAAIVADGERIGWKTVRASGDTLTFEFPTGLAPEQIVLYPNGEGDNPDACVTFDAATKKVLD